MPRRKATPAENDYDIAAPRAHAMIQSLRAFGYDLPTGLADLIDNSISAEARNVWLEFIWDGAASTIAVIDDGRGMSEAELVNAMRPGSRSPLEQRSAKDLGRFGLGLKTASFSQCQRLTVASKPRRGTVSVRCWDLQYVTKTDEWRLLRSGSAALRPYLDTLGDLSSGTVVLWEAIDRLVAGTKTQDETSHKLFLECITDVKRHLAMVFQRFLDRPNPVRIFLNTRQVKAWDPFLIDEGATQLLAEETLTLKRQRHEVKCYVLPHHSRLRPEVHEDAAGPKGWNAQQGFYVYRNNRLLVPGDWLGLGFQKEEHYKLARILLNIPNSLDSEWEIDVKKSRACPPSALRRDLRRVAILTRQNACEVYRHRGKVIARQAAADFVFVWQQKARRSKLFYQINREHPLVKALMKDSKTRDRTNALIRLLEETVPVPLIAITNAEKPDTHGQPFEARPSREVVGVMTETYQALLSLGYSPDDAKRRLGAMEPFSSYPELV